MTPQPTARLASTATGSPDPVTTAATASSAMAVSTVSWTIRLR